MRSSRLTINTGYTLIELVVVLVIIVVLMSLIIVKTPFLSQRQLALNEARKIGLLIENWRERAQSEENPVYYVQMAHARMSGIFRVGEIDPASITGEGADLSLLDNPAEQDLYKRITALWESVEWDWYRGDPKSDFIYWHWSKEWAEQIRHPLIGFNEVMITYILAMSSPTHGVPVDMYYSGWAGQSQTAFGYRGGWSGFTDGDHYGNGHTYYGIKLDVGVATGGPLFFTHYSYIGFDPHAPTERRQVEAEHAERQCGTADL